MRSATLAFVSVVVGTGALLTLAGCDQEAPTGGDGGLDGGGDGGVQDARVPPDGDAAGPDASAPPLVRNEDFAEASTDVRNPDRGFYWWDWNEDAALVLVKVYLGEQCAVATLPASVLGALRTRLDGHRGAGRRVILRFNYADDGVLNACGLADAESLDLVLGHVAQLAPVFTDYEDVIAYVEAGFFGMWGEWNQEHAPEGTSLSETEPNRDALLLALLAAVPATRSIEVRRPRFRDELGATGDSLARLGFHNDCFLASADDYGTYDGSHDIATWKAYIRDATLTVPMGGETCNDDPTYTVCLHALAELEQLRFSYLHEGYSPQVIARWESEGCLGEIRRRLGYRIVVLAVEAPLTVAFGELLRVRIELSNAGFAPPYDARRVQLRLRNLAGDAVDLGGPDTLDVTSWEPGTSFALSLSRVIPDGLQPGTWEVRLVLLEDVSDLPAYAMLFANDERVRDDVLRENRVATVVITESPAASP